MKIIETSSLDFNSTLSVNEREWIYNGFDAAVTHEIRDHLLPYFDDVAQKTYDFSKVLQAPIIEMSLRGLLVDPTEKLRTLTAIRKDIAFLEERLFQLIEDGIGTRPSSPTWWRSPTQLATILYTVIGLKPILKRNARGQMAPTTNRDAIEKLSINFIAEPICNHILILRDLDKKRSFLETGIDPDGRYRYGFNIAGTNTGRLSSSASDFGTGSNAQNIGRSLRHIFIADPGMKFGNLDLEQADSRNLGAMCWELFYEQMGSAAGKYLDACESGDLHTFVCRMANTQLPWPEGMKGWRAIADQIAYRDFSYRDMAKRLGHGTNYYGTAPTMARNTKVPLPQVKEFQSAYFRGFPEIPKFHQWVKDQLRGPSHIITPYGFRRFFFGRHTDDSTIREAIACGPQSMTASEINIGLMNVWRANRVQLLVQVHDSLLFQYPEEQEDEIIPWALEALRAPIRLQGGREFCVPTEAKVGWNWGDLVPWTAKDFSRGLCTEAQVGTAKENPDGLIKYKGTDKRRRAYRPRLSVRNF